MNTLKQNKKATFKDYTGEVFGRLTVIETFRPDKYTKCVCKCECGNIKTINATDLVRGRTKSCGCLQKESAIKTHTKHGLRHTRIYKTWEDIKKRCLNSKTRSYKNYGGRGITVCDEWLTFKPFYDWAMANGYNDTLTIDRINVDGNYEPNNCKWATMKEQQNNKRTNRKYKEAKHEVEQQELLHAES